MAFIFVAFLIPSKEYYLKNKYKNEFDNYKAQTKKLIPWVY
jgi:protein-S-isoprenylcysteine O-methyltransferase Ste14